MIIHVPNDYAWQADHVYILCFMIIRDLRIMIDKQIMLIICALWSLVILMIIVFFVMETNTILHLYFSMPFIAEIDTKSSGSGYERHLQFF